MASITLRAPSRPVHLPVPAHVPMGRTYRARPKRTAIPAPAEDSLPFVCAMGTYAGVVLEILHHMAWDASLDAGALLGRVDTYMREGGPDWGYTERAIARRWSTAYVREPGAAWLLARQMVAAKRG